MRAASHTVIAVIDFSNASPDVLRRALAIAAGHERAEVHVVALTGAGGGVLHRRERARAQVAGLDDRLQGFLREFGATHTVPGTDHVRLFRHARLGEPREEIVALAAEAEADLIVLGRPHEEDGERTAGLAAFILHQQVCSVLIVEERGYEQRPRLVGRFHRCPACDAVRQETGGTRWVCEEHEAEGLRRAAPASLS